MNTSGIIPTSIPHNIKDPHSKFLESGCLSPRMVITTQPRGERGTEEVYSTLRKDYIVSRNQSDFRQQTDGFVA